jgi:hypothetical protein
MQLPYQRGLALLAVGHESGWWDEDGNPGPWPADLFDPDADWRPATNPPPTPAPVEQPSQPHPTDQPAHHSEGLEQARVLPVTERRPRRLPSIEPR